MLQCIVGGSNGIGPAVGVTMKLRVLLVGDNAERARAVTLGLQAEDCEVVVVVPNALALVAEVRRSAAEVVVCDLDSPSRDVLDSLRALYRDEPRPVAMFVDQSDPASTIAAIEAGVAAYVIEGLSPKRVRSVLDVAIARFHNHQGLRAELSAARAALEARKLVERAKGILMQSRNMTEDEAFRTLRGLAMEQGKKLAEIAGGLISVQTMLKPTRKPLKK